MGADGGVDELEDLEGVGGFAQVGEWCACRRHMLILPRP